MGISSHTCWRSNALVQLQRSLGRDARPLEFLAWAKGFPKLSVTSKYTSFAVPSRSTTSNVSICRVPLPPGEWDMSRQASSFAPRCSCSTRTLLRCEWLSAMVKKTADKGEQGHARPPRDARRTGSAPCHTLQAGGPHGSRNPHPTAQTGQSGPATPYRYRRVGRHS
jgi:hypothetical protein